MSTIGIIQARMGSERLPGKVLLPLVNSESVLTALIKRVTNSGIDWWVATTNNPEDDLIESWATFLGLKVFRGSETNVLSRFTSIAREVEPTWIVRVTADDPFMSSEEVKKLIILASNANESTALICDNPKSRVYPLGYCPEIVRAEALFGAERAISPSESYHRSHVTSYLRPYSQFITLDEGIRHPELRWTIDTREDLQLAQAIFNKLQKTFSEASYVDFLEICLRSPELMDINRHIRQKDLSDG